MVFVSDRDRFIESINQEVERRARAEERESVIHFSRLLFLRFPLEELQGREVTDIFGLLYACWESLQVFDVSTPKLAIYNPSMELHGWRSSRSIIQVVARDMAFLVGSIMGELNSRNITIHAIHNTVVHTQRDDKHQLLDIRGRNDNAEGFDSEALVYVEITRHSGASLEELSTAISEVIREVDAVVSDFPAMGGKAKEVRGELRAREPGAEQQERVDEGVEFMDWLFVNHFTFLGYQELEFDGTDATLNAASNLGLARLGYLLNLDICNDLLRKQPSVMEPIQFGRFRVQSRVHRRAYPDVILVWRYDSAGTLSGAHCFLGLFTSAVHTGSVYSIPVVNRKLNNILERASYEKNSHNGREIVRIHETFPRAELFCSSEDTLFDITMDIFRMRERRQVRLFTIIDDVFGFASCLVYVPRNLYHTVLRQKIEAILADALGSVDVNMTTYISESVLARVHFMFRIEPGQHPDVDVALLEQELASASRSWEERLRESLIEELGEEQGCREMDDFLDSFPPGYQYDFEPRVAVSDIRQIRRLASPTDLGMNFSRAQQEASDAFRFRLVREGEPLILSDVIPILENFGLRVVAEHSHRIVAQTGAYSLQEFALDYGTGQSLQLESVTEHFNVAFHRIWTGESENDAFNKLLLGAQLDWRQVAVMRAYARYMKQLAFPYSEAFVAETLCKHLDITRDILRYFEVRFTPLDYQQASARTSAEGDIRQRILSALDQVASLNEDGVIRHFLTLIDATLRTSYFQTDANGASKSNVSFKINTVTIEDAPRPRPEFEIFVYSPKVEGVHLRGGTVARGGLRWSDRYEDFRTEVLGLVKAQQVKNAVIVPVGAKGGFVCKRLPGLVSREEKQKEGLSCYKTFIRGLLDITDNLVVGEIVPPQNVVRKDGDDPYLVVAADKGTATFSDTANAVAAEYDFWLGDAFASGGEFGYDHKKMGITARSAWICVQRHFRELGINIQETPFTVVGVGDMSGDVFGNGMLLSQSIQLTAAFNHLHIFVDPNPDIAASFKERQRLFELPRSNWADYNASLISEGGGVFSRSAKSIAISAQMRERFAIEQTRLTPAQLIKALLKAPVDLLWNGGIGTYVKSSVESHADVGDKANDAVRINAPELRVRVVGEGGNLGLTQLSRVEFDLAGGALNTDFIDNAGGVDCSDYEVNIKILLNDIVASGDMTIKQRNILLAEMTDAVADLVLHDSDSQACAISVVQSRSCRGMEELLRFVHELEASGRLDRELEFIPDDETLRERRNQGKGFSRPELAVLSAYGKAQLKEELATGCLQEEPYMLSDLADGFPARISENYSEAMQGHRLSRQIIAKNLANEMINTGGITFAHRMRESSGADYDAIAKSFVFARDVFRVRMLFDRVSSLNYQVDASVQYQLLDRITGLLRGASRWFLLNRCYAQPLGEQVEFFAASVTEVWDNLSLFLQGSMAEYWEDSYQRYIEAGVDEELASVVAGGPILFHTLNIAEASQAGDMPLLDVARLFFRIGEDLGLTGFSRQIVEMKVENHWQAIAREGLLDDIGAEQKAIAVAILSMDNQEDALERWIEARQPLVDRWQASLADLNSSARGEFAMYSVVLRELANLGRAEALQ
jgi:glutamate dehydrogenase